MHVYASFVFHSILITSSSKLPGEEMLAHVRPRLFLKDSQHVSKLSTLPSLDYVIKVAYCSSIPNVDSLVDPVHVDKDVYRSHDNLCSNENNHLKHGRQ